MTWKPIWVDGRVDALLAALHDLGMSVSRAAAADLIGERVRWVSAQMDISPTAARDQAGRLAVHHSAGLNSESLAATPELAERLTARVPQGIGT